MPCMAKTMNQMHNSMISSAGNGGKVNPLSRSRQQAGDGCRENLGCSCLAGMSLLQTGWAVETKAGGQMRARDCLSSGTWHSAQRVCSHRSHQWTPGYCSIQSPRFLCDCLLNACPQNWHPDSLKSPLQTPNVQHLNPRGSTFKTPPVNCTDGKTQRSMKSRVTTQRVLWGQLSVLRTYHRLNCG